MVLDGNLTPELIEEGFVRELISKIQTMRKEAGFEVMDKIRVYAGITGRSRRFWRNTARRSALRFWAEEIILDMDPRIWIGMEH